MSPDSSSTPQLVLTDDPAPGIRRHTLNRPEKRNAMNHALRGQLLAGLEEGDQDPEVRVQVIRANGPSFCAGYDLKGDPDGVLPFHTAGGDGQWPRHQTDSWMKLWDLAKPVIAQVHGYCLAGGSELATGCDLVYIAEDARMGYPAVRFGVPDMHFHAWFVGMRTAMEMMLTGDSLTGVEAVEKGWANRAFPVERLEAEVLAVAAKIAALPPDVVQLNKRVVHRGMEVMGLRTAIRFGTELCALGVHTETMERFVTKVRERGLTTALQERDEPFGDYRTAAQQPAAPE